MSCGAFDPGIDFAAKCPEVDRFGEKRVRLVINYENKNCHVHPPGLFLSPTDNLHHAADHDIRFVPIADIATKLLAKQHLNARCVSDALKRGWSRWGKFHSKAADTEIAPLSIR